MQPTDANFGFESAKSQVAGLDALPAYLTSGHREMTGVLDSAEDSRTQTHRSSPGMIEKEMVP